MATAEHKPQAEFSRIVEAERAAAGDVRLDIVATPTERAQLARRFGFLDLPTLSAQAVLSRADGKGTLRLKVHWTADVVQSCVVSLEPVETHLDRSCELLFVPADTALAHAEEREIIVAIDSEDPPELLVDGKVDVGEVIAEQLALNVEPYPRKAGVDLSAVWNRQPASDERPDSPFAVLQQRRGRA